MKRKLLSGLLALCMAFTLMPMQALATTGGNTAQDTSSVTDSGTPPTISDCTCLSVDNGEPTHGENCPLYVATMPVMAGRQGRGVTTANGLLAGRYSYNQVLDCQRPTSPEAVPVGGSFLVNNFKVPLLITPDEKKIVYFKAMPGEDDTLFSLWMADDVEGSNGKAEILEGRIYGLADKGFLYVDTKTAFGFFISNQEAYDYGDDVSVTYKSDTIGAITHTRASEYDANTNPQFLNPNVFIIAFDPTGGSVNPRGGTTGTDSKLASLPTPIRANHRFDGWFTEANGGAKVTTGTVFEGRVSIFAHWTYTGGGSVTDSDDSDDSIAPPVNNVIDTPVGSSGSTNQLADAANTAIVESKTSATAYVNYANYQALTMDGLKAINNAAANAVAGKTLQLNTKLRLDNKAGNVVLSRISVDPTKLTAVMPEKLPLGVWFDQQNDAPVSSVKAVFEKDFDNNLVVVTFEQKTPLGANMELALKPDMSKLNTKNLYFYSYNPESNLYYRVWSPDYWVDQNGYTHITAPLGGSIIITDKPLTLK